MPDDEESCLFCGIVRGDVPSDKVVETDQVLAFRDIDPKAPTHILVIPKGPYVSWDDFSERASDGEIAGFVRAVGKIARDLGLVGAGYRLLANVGVNAGQEVPHLHAHIFGGRPLGPMLAREGRPSAD